MCLVHRIIMGNSTFLVHWMTVGHFTCLVFRMIDGGAFLLALYMGWEWITVLDTCTADNGAIYLPYTFDCSPALCT